MTRPEWFADEARLRASFLQGLNALLQHQSLGTFILVLANAKFDPALDQALHQALQQRFMALHRDVRSQLLAGQEHLHTPDDLYVFLKLVAVGLEHLPGARFRRAGPWEIQYNPLRAFRPARMSQARIDCLQTAFDPNAFHFDKPFLQKEVFWQGQWQGRFCQLFYNKFPFAPLHGLLVPEPKRHLPQWLTWADHQWAWSILEEIGGHIFGCGLGYNARGAHASVNHLHFQFYAGKQRPYPIEHNCWRHHGGMYEYPLPCQYFTHPEAAWAYIQELHAQNRPYNLLYRPGKVYVLTRAMQGQYKYAAWNAGLAWAEAAGAFTLFHPDDFQTIEAHAIEQEMRKLA